jgi:predicted Zn-dependent peptidase
MRTSLIRYCHLALLALVCAGCAAPMTTVDPRTMTYPSLTFNVPKTVRVVLDNGMIVHLHEDHELPLVSMTAYVRTGSIYEPAEKAGLAGLTGTVMRSGGTREYTPEQMDADLEFMASAVESGIGSDVGNVSLTSLKRNLDRTLQYFAQVLREPVFREDRITLARNSTIEALRRQNDNPKGIADRELRKALYAGHPLGRFSTIDTVKRITRDDMVAFHRTYYHPDNIILAVSGDFDREELLSRLRTLFAGWEKGGTVLPAIADPAPIRPEVLFARKDVNQSVIRMGHLGVDKNNPDIYPLRVMDYILGGGFTSRLTTEIRSNQGLAYSVDSNFDFGRRFVGTFTAMTETKSASTAKAINLMKKIIAGMTEAPVTNQELDTAREAIINSFIFGFAKPESIVNMQVRLEYYGYPQGYLENYRDNISRVTREDVLRVARTYLHPEAMILMVVGNDRNFDQPLATYGPVREITLENGK